MKDAEEQSGPCKSNKGDDHLTHLLAHLPFPIWIEAQTSSESTMLNVNNSSTIAESRTTTPIWIKNQHINSLHFEQIRFDANVYILYTNFDHLKLKLLLLSLFQ